MCYSATAITRQGRHRDNYIQYVKMGLNRRKRSMNQEEKEKDIPKAISDTAFLYDLLRRCREGDTTAMEAIYESYKKPIFNLAYRYTYNTAVAEDLLQDTFMKLFTNIKNLKKEEYFVGWLYRIALNTCYSYLRSRKNHFHKTVPLSEAERKINEKTHDSQDNILKKPLDDAIQGLPHMGKSIFFLHDVQGFKHREIAQMLGCSVGTSKSQLFKARMKIRQYLKNKQLL